MRTIYKFPLVSKAHQVVQVAKGLFPAIRHFGLDPSGVMCLWVEIEEPDGPGLPVEEHSVFRVGTGQPIPPNAGPYIGTVCDGPFVWHFYSPTLLRSFN